MAQIPVKSKGMHMDSAPKSAWISAVWTSPWCMAQPFWNLLYVRCKKNIWQWKKIIFRLLCRSLDKERCHFLNYNSRCQPFNMHLDRISGVPRRESPRRRALHPRRPECFFPYSMQFTRPLGQFSTLCVTMQLLCIEKSCTGCHHPMAKGMGPNITGAPCQPHVLSLCPSCMRLYRITSVCRIVVLPLWSHVNLHSLSVSCTECHQKLHFINDDAVFDIYMGCLMVG